MVVSKGQRIALAAGGVLVGLLLIVAIFGQAAEDAEPAPSDQDSSAEETPASDDQTADDDSEEDQVPDPSLGPDQSEDDRSDPLDPHITPDQPTDGADQPPDDDSSSSSIGPQFADLQRLFARSQSLYKTIEKTIADGVTECDDYISLQKDLDNLSQNLLQQKETYNRMSGVERGLLNTVFGQSGSGQNAPAIQNQLAEGLEEALVQNQAIERRLGSTCAV